MAILFCTTGRLGGHFTLNLILCANISLSTITNNWLRISRAQGCHKPTLVLHFHLRYVSDDGRGGSIPRCIICIIYRHLLKLSPTHKCISSLVLACCILFTHSIDHLHAEMAAHERKFCDMSNVLSNFVFKILLKMRGNLKHYLRISGNSDCRINRSGCSGSINEW